MDYLQTRLTEFDQFSFSQGDAKQRFVQSTILAYLCSLSVYSHLISYIFFASILPKWKGKSESSLSIIEGVKLKTGTLIASLKKIYSHFY